MSRTTPVRWWRDDADRYRARGAYVAPERQWTVEQLVDSKTIRQSVEGIHAAMVAAEPWLGWTPTTDAEREKMRRFAEHVLGSKP